eukprot:2076643-Amphidinium_carterae.1
MVLLAFRSHVDHQYASAQDLIERAWGDLACRQASEDTDSYLCYRVMIVIVRFSASACTTVPRPKPKGNQSI